MPALLSLILENFLELLFNLISQLPSLFGLDRRSKRRKRSESPPNYARLMFYSAILGALIGIAAVMVFPALALKPNSWGAFTCVSNVLLLGVVAELYGRLRKKLGKPKMPIAAFWGGATLAFGISLARLGNVNDFWKKDADEVWAQPSPPVNESPNSDAGSTELSVRRTRAAHFEAHNIVRESKDPQASSMDSNVCK